jgi:hypothetical protein
MQAGASLNSAFKQHRRDKMEQAVNTMRVLLVACGLLVFLPPFQALAQQNRDRAATTLAQSPNERDGQHDFDFEIGTWKIHLSRLQDRLAGSKT